MLFAIVREDDGLGIIIIEIHAPRFIKRLAGWRTWWRLGRTTPVGRICGGFKSVSTTMDGTAGILPYGRWPVVK